MLRHVPLFAGISDDALAALEKHAVTKKYPRNMVIINEGDESGSLYIIQEGKVRIYLSDEDGKEVVLNTQGPGEYFGELSLLDDEPRSASVMTAEDSRLSIISKASFQQWLNDDPQAAVALLRGLAGRMRLLTENVRSLALMDVYGRVARTLLNLAEEQDGKLVVTEKLTHRDIASRVGSSREMVSRIFKELTVGGYISVDKRMITINSRLPAAW